MAPRILGSVAALLTAATVRSSDVPLHSQFNLNVDQGTGTGVIELMADTSLRLNVKGGELKHGDPLVLYPCTAHGHELFDLEDGVIKLRANPGMCLNAQGGPGDGAQIVTWHCGKVGETVEHEEFYLGRDGRIRLRKHKDKCINVKGGEAKQGAELILYPCSDEGMSHNDVFVYEEGMLKLKSHPSLHLNVAGAETQKSGNVVLWGCQASRNEVFEFHANRLRLGQVPDLCVNAEEGVGANARLVIWPCHQDGELPNEMFRYDEELKVIRSQVDDNLAFNVREAAMHAGSEIVLWPLVEGGQEL
eukprot:TRINITY_DN101464_c0_g1_i1.p1 TRINITY_DN101464_c0_g1~~TRINITY_DN101464_c0_g1_i1.p1  ORF type:complete len:304 (+),score=74.15 TRINITY_DN101464_c0_g1_i1:89-1000(+)